MSLTDVLGFSSQFSLVDLLLSTPAVSLFLRAFQVVVQAVPNACVMALINFPSFPSFKLACYFP